MKKRSRILSLLVAGLMVTGCLAGCGAKETDDKKGGTSATDIEISYWNSGLGTDWLDAVIAGFEKKYPEYNVYYNATASSTAVVTAYGLEDTDTIDLYLATKQYDMTHLEPLNDVLDATADGDTKTIKEKFDADYLLLEEYDGKYYNLTHGGGVLSFVYNTKLFEQAGITQVPRTSDELALVCGTLSDNNIKPLCHFKPSGYYEWLTETWFSQYNGLDYYRDFYANPTKDKMMAQDGRYEAIKAYEKFITPENVLQGSNSEQHVSIQTKFLQEKCAIMLNGSWLSNEMSNSGKMNDFEMMKTPVISAITDNLTTVKSEPELRKLITAIDNVTDGVETVETYKDGDNYKVDGKSVSSADWDYVKSARNSVSTNYSGETAFIPNYSNAKEGAKEFLKYLYSDEGYQIYIDTLHIKMPLELSKGEINTEGWNTFEKNQAELFDKAEHSVSNDIMNKHRIFVDGGASSTADYEFISLMCSNSEADRVSAEEAWDYIVKNVEEKYENEWLKNIK